MSDYRNPSYRWGGTAARAGADVDQGLRSYMLGVYNNMVLGLAVTGLVPTARACWPSRPTQRRPRPASTASI